MRFDWNSLRDFGYVRFEHFLKRQVAKEDHIEIASCFEHTDGSLQIIFCQCYPVPGILAYHLSYYTLLHNFSLPVGSIGGARMPPIGQAANVQIYPEIALAVVPGGVPFGTAPARARAKPPTSPVHAVLARFWIVKTLFFYAATA